MATANKNSTNQTVTVFDSFYNINLVVNASEYDIVYSYFLGVSDNPLNGVLSIDDANTPLIYTLEKLFLVKLPTTWYHLLFVKI
jgi:hypothetical protein